MAVVIVTLFEDGEGQLSGTSGQSSSLACDSVMSGHLLR